MSRRTLIIVSTAAALALTAGCAGPQSSTRSATAAPANASAAADKSAPAAAVARSYRYYPDEQIYFCEDREIYFWINSFGSWSRGEALPTRAMIGDYGDFESVRLHVDDPTLFHSSFARAFPPSGANRTHSQSQAIVTVTIDDWQR